MEENHKDNHFIFISFLLSAIVLGVGGLYVNGIKIPLFDAEPLKNSRETDKDNLLSDDDFQELVLPSQGVEILVKWGSLGLDLAKSGVIDAEKFESVYANRGGLDEEMKKFLSGENNGNIKMTLQNSGVWLNLLWALGLGNKNVILENGPMNDSKYGGADGFASTGGWSLAKGDAMDHYSKHSFLTLTSEQQMLVEKVAKNIYRPCCGNSTYFPDCNHGMAMLGLLELMVSQGMSESEMYKAALQVNSYWFPDTYITIAKYMKLKAGIDWADVNPEEVLGADYSSGSGYRKILQEVEPETGRNGGSCGV